MVYNNSSLATVKGSFTMVFVHDPPFVGIVNTEQACRHTSGELDHAPAMHCA